MSLTHQYVRDCVLSVFSALLTVFYTFTYLCFATPRGDRLILVCSSWRRIVCLFTALVNKKIPTPIIRFFQKFIMIYDHYLFIYYIHVIGLNPPINYAFLNLCKIVYINNDLYLY